MVEVPPKNLLVAGVDKPDGADVEALTEGLPNRPVEGCLPRLLNNPLPCVVAGGVEAPLSFF